MNPLPSLVVSDVGRQHDFPSLMVPQSEVEGLSAVGEGIPYGIGTDRDVCMPITHLTQTTYHTNWRWTNNQLDSVNNLFVFWRSSARVAQGNME